MGFVLGHLFASEFSTAPYFFIGQKLPLRSESRYFWRRQKLKNTLCSLFHTHKTEPDLKQTELLESKHVSINSGLSCHLRAFSRHKAKPEREDVCFLWNISTRQERQKDRNRERMREIIRFQISAELCYLSPTCISCPFIYWKSNFSQFLNIFLTFQEVENKIVIHLPK